MKPEVVRVRKRPKVNFGDTSSEQVQIKFGRRWMSRTEMAKYLNVSLQTLDWLRKTRRIPAVKLGRRVVMDQVAVDSAIAKLEIKAAGQD